MNEMDPSIRAMKLTAAINDAFPHLQVDVRVARPKVADTFHHPPNMLLQVGDELRIWVVTVTIWGVNEDHSMRKATFKESHGVHAIMAWTFWDDSRAFLQLLTP